MRVENQTAPGIKISTLHLDEAPLKVRVDDARCSGRQCPVVQRPGPHLVVARGEVVDHVELLVARLDDARQSGVHVGALRVAELHLVMREKNQASKGVHSV